jgi:hypothetical protein
MVESRVLGWEKEKDKEKWRVKRGEDFHALPPNLKRRS